MKHLRNSIILIVAALLISSCASVEVRAVRHGDMQKLEKFLSKGGDPNTVDTSGNGLIHIAVQYGQEDSLRALLNAGANRDLLNRAGNSALILAVGKNAVNLVDILLDYGADPTRKGRGGKTTLMVVAGNGNVTLMKLLVSKGVEIEAVDNSGSSALFYSVTANRPEALLFLLNSGADAGLIDNKGRTALHFLTKNRQRPIARMLIQAGADPSRIQDLTGETPLHIASGSGAWELVEEYLGNKRVRQQVNLLSVKRGSPLLYAMTPGLPSQAAVNTMKKLLDAGADPNLTSVKNVLPIVYAVEKLDAPRVELLVQAGSNVNIRPGGEKTLLHLAVARNNPKIVSVLLRAGIDPDLLDKQGNTALFTAVDRSYIASTETLLNSGSDTNIINNKGQTVLYISLKKDADRKSGISKETSLLLRHNAALPPGKKILSELLLRTTTSGNADVARILLKNGADPNSREQNGMTLLMLSSSRRFIKLSEVLLKGGAGINVWDKSGNTAMHYASSAGSIDGVKLLLRYGEDPDAENYETVRPIQLAPQNDQGNKIVEILLAAGAQPVPQKAEQEKVADTNETPLLVDKEAVAKEPVAKAQSSDKIIPESGSEAIVSKDTKEKAAPAEDLVVTDQKKDVKDNQSEDSKGEQVTKAEWGKAKVLFVGQDEPRKVSKERISFKGFLANVPKSYPKNLHSQSNKRKVTLYILNETRVAAEIYFITTGGKINAVQTLSPWESTSIKTREGNVYPVYTQDNNYFGEIKTTGQKEQYFRLAEKE